MAERSLSATFSHPATPPSFNQVGHSGSRWAWTKAKKEWQETFELLLMSTGFPRDWQRIEVAVELRFPDRRRRDVVNFRTLIEKCLGDALVNGRWLPDDTPDHFEITSFRFAPEPGPAQTRISLEAT